jgi:hypothetical protein
MPLVGICAGGIGQPISLPRPIPLLLKGGADVHARDSAGNTALDKARRSKNQVAVELLLAAMSDAR